MNGKRKICLTVLAGLCACSVFAAFGCAEKGKQPEEEEEKTEELVMRDYESGAYTLLDFNAARDLYAVKPYIQNVLNAYGTIDVVTERSEDEAERGYLNFDYRGGTSPALSFFPAKSAYPDMNLYNLQSFGIGLCVPSLQDGETASVTLAIASKTERIWSEEREVQAGWNTLTLELDPVFVRYRAEEITAFCVQFETGPACEYYLDDFTVTLGETELNGAQKSAIEFAEKISALSDGITLGSGTDLCRANALYRGLLPIHRTAVGEYFGSFSEYVKEYLELLSKQEGDGDGKTFLYFGREEGLLQLALNETDPFSYDAAESRVNFALDGTQEKYVFGFLLPTVVVSDYDYLSFTLSNPTDHYVAVSLNNSSEFAVCAPQSTTVAELPASALKESGNTLTLATVEYDGRKVTGYLKSEATVGLSALSGRVLPEEEMYSCPLDGETPFSLSGASATLQKAEKKYAVSSIGEGMLRISLNKSVQTVNIAQSVTFGVRADEAVFVTVCDDSGRMIETLRFGRGENILTLSAGTYNAASYFELNGYGNGFTFTDFYLSRTADVDYIDVLLQSEDVVSGELVTKDTFREAFYYLCAFESLSAYKQNYLKVYDRAVYDEIAKRAERVSTVMADALLHYEAGVSDDTEDGILLELSDAYQKLKCVTKLTNAQLKILNGAKTALAAREYTVFDFLNPLSGKLFVPMTNDRLPNGNYYYQWSGSAYLDEFDGGAVMALEVQSPSEEKYLYAKYDYSSMDALLKNYDYVNFRIYNPNGKEAEIVFIAYAWQSTVAKYSLPANQWTELKISVTDFKRAGYFVIRFVSAGDKFYFDNVTACSWQYVQSAVDALPELADLTPEHRPLVAAAREKYDSLSYAGRLNVNAEKLEACERALQKMPFVVFDMDDEGVLDSFSAHPDTSAFPRYSWTGDITLTESEYGKTLQANVASTSSGIVYIGYNLTGISLTGYDYISFRAYNSKPASVRLVFISKGWGAKGYECQLAASGWTDVCVPVAAFNLGYIYLDYISTNVTLRFTDFVAYGADAVQAMINALPSPEQLTQADREKIVSVRAAYDSLTAESQAIVDETKLIACEDAFRAMPYTVFDMDDENVLGNFAPHPADGTSLTSYVWTGTVETVDGDDGKMMQVNVQSTNSGVVYIGYTVTGLDLSGYDYVSFKVYNSTATALRFAFITQGWGAKGYECQLAAEAWTEVCVPVSAFKMGYLYLSHVTSATLRFTDFVAYGAQTVQGMINALPEASAVTEADRAQTEEARKAYDALSENAKAQVDTARLEECEEALQ